MKQLIMCLFAMTTLSASASGEESIKSSSLLETSDKACDYLNSTISTNGRLGTGSNMIESTSFALSALLRADRTYRRSIDGKTIARAYNWLVKSEPSTTNDVLAVAVALSDHYTVHRTKAAKEKVEELLGSIDSGAGYWREVLCFTRLPDESKRPAWALARDKEVIDKYSAKTDTILLKSRDDILKAHVEGLAKYFSIGTDRDFDRYHRLHCKTLLDSQQQDGSFKGVAKEDQALAAASAAFCRSFGVHGGHRFFPPRAKTEEPVPKQTKEIEAEIL